MTVRGTSRWARGVISALAGAVAWGLSGTCIQFLLSATEIGALPLTTARQLGAGIVFLVVLLARHRNTLRSLLAVPDARRRLAVFGSCGLFLNSTLYALSVAHTNAGTATVLQSLSIVLALVTTCVLTRRAPCGPELAALACALAATFLIATHGEVGTLSMPPEGLALGLLTATTAAFYTMYPRPLFRHWGSFAVTGMGMLVGGTCGLIICLVTGTVPATPPALDATSLTVLAVAVLVGTFGAYGLFLHGIALVGPVWGNMLGAAEPVSATVIAAVWLGTTFSWADWVALALMVATIMLVGWQTGRRRDGDADAGAAPTAGGHANVR